MLRVQLLNKQRAEDDYASSRVSIDKRQVPWLLTPEERKALPIGVLRKLRQLEREEESARKQQEAGDELEAAGGDRELGLELDDAASEKRRRTAAESQRRSDLGLPKRQTRRFSIRPVGSPEASASARSCLRLPTDCPELRPT